MRALRLVAVLAVLLLTGCKDQLSAPPVGSSGPGVLDSDESVKVVDVPIGDGRTVKCAVYDGFQSGGISCDWSQR